MSLAGPRFVLGAAQLGLAYGIANRNRGAADAQALLSAAEAAGVDVVDTAAAYGTSEKVIGEYLRAYPGSSLQVVSKLHPDTDIGDAGGVRDAVAASVDRIGRPLAAVLLHDPQRIGAWSGPLGEGLARARDEGLVAVIGASVYTADQFATALNLEGLGHIQAPFNVLDRRLLDQGLLARAATAGVTVHLRSVYLQGLLVLERLPERMAFARPAVQAFQDICAAYDLRPAAAAIGWASRRAGKAALVVGCDTPFQLQESLSLMDGAGITDGCLSCLDALPQAEDAVVNPASWPPSEASA